MYTETKTSMLNDKMFLTQFENQTLPLDCFDHRGRLRLVWLYLRQYDVETASKMTCLGILTYAESFGPSTKFHMTITDSIVRIVAKRMQCSKDDGWQSFLDSNPDLVDNSLGILYQHFSKELLFCERARITTVQPDLKPL